ncbi:Transmembrane amino acid transporter family protein [Abeliophyllum distichum]|uniref:Transmembrane amino acid transporter family protein n=1 Tax=Abeliophyllum distichum TaxID=126358 RepID=A0ABD1VX15_9LAMI
MAPANSGTGAEAPLLPDVVAGKRASIPGAVFNVATSIIGAGIMSIPATLKVLGVFPAFVMIAVIALLVDISVEFMLRFTYSGESRTYAGLMRESFGKAGSVAVQIAVMITNLGCLIIYLIIIGDVLSGKGVDHLGVLQEWFGIHWWNLRPVALLFIVVLVMLPLVLFRRVESLWLSSAVSVFLAVVFVGICSVMAITALVKGETITPRWVPQLDNGTSFFNLFTAVPVIVTAFTFHFNVHAIGVEMGKPADMLYAVKIALALCAAIYFTIGIFGYLLFGDSTMDDILVNFDQSSGSAINSFLNDAVRLSYAFHLMLVFPLLNFSLRTNIDEFLFSTKKPAFSSKQQKIFGPHFCFVSIGLCFSHSHSKYLVFLPVYGINFCSLPSIHISWCHCIKRYSWNFYGKGQDHSRNHDYLEHKETEFDWLVQPSRRSLEIDYNQKRPLIKDQKPLLLESRSLRHSTPIRWKENPETSQAAQLRHLSQTVEEMAKLLKGD